MGLVSVLLAEQQAALTALSVRADTALAAVFAMSGTNFDALVQVAEPVVSEFGDVAAVLSADYYDAAREQAGASGAFAAEPAPAPSVDRVSSVTGWGLREGSDVAGQLALIRGGLVRSVLGTGRDTVRAAAAADHAAYGWSRVARASGCRFCRMLAGRGTVYRKDTARFGSHDHCHCFAAPAFAPGLAVSVEQHVATQRHVTAVDRARLRAYLAQMGD